MKREWKLIFWNLDEKKLLNKGWINFINYFDNRIIMIIYKKLKLNRKMNSQKLLKKKLILYKKYEKVLLLKD